MKVPRVGKPELIAGTIGIVLFVGSQLSTWVQADYPSQPGVVGTSGVLFGALIVGLLFGTATWVFRFLIAAVRSVITS